MNSCEFRVFLNFGKKKDDNGSITYSIFDDKLIIC